LDCALVTLLGLLDILKQLYSMIPLSIDKSKDTTEELWIFLKIGKVLLELEQL